LGSLETEVEGGYAVLEVVAVDEGGTGGDPRFGVY
jgi:hypothetical protein